MGHHLIGNGKSRLARRGRPYGFEPYLDPSPDPRRIPIISRLPDLPVRVKAAALRQSIRFARLLRAVAPPDGEKVDALMWVVSPALDTRGSIGHLEFVIKA
jgi:hypothetical protein